MKRLLIVSIMMTAWLLSCKEEELDPQPERVQFTFAVTESPNAGGRTQSDLPEGASLVISLSDNAGNPVLTHHSLDILEIGDSYISEPLDLVPGRYQITDFFITNGSQVIYAAPKKGSALASLITAPLPRAFTISRNGATNIGVQVLDARQNEPGDFGYAAFTINIISPLRVSVLTMDAGGIAFTNAAASVHTVIGDLPYFFDYPLGAKVNTLPLEGGPNNDYTLTIQKDGYKTYTKTFRYSELIAELGDKPLTVVLEQAVSIRYNNTTQSYSFWLQCTGTGSVTVSWGDGEEETVDFDSDTPAEIYLAHQYSGLQAWFPIDITGDINAITGLRSAASGMSGLNTMFANKLSTLIITNGEGSTLDLTQNYLLTQLSLSNSFFNQVLLPDYHYIANAEITNFKTNSPGDVMIDNIYGNAVFRNIRDGNFVYRNSTPAPSPEAIQKLEDLRDSYGWTISVE